MRLAWVGGTVHALIGGAILFLSLHPLRDALDAHALDLARTGSTFEALIGIILMLAAANTRARLATTAMAVGITVFAAMLYFIVFTGLRPPIIVLVPIGGATALLGLAALIFAGPGRP
ncbi:MAG: DUF423 domain-containing protein [Parvularculaceae bacterium]|jgi:uncharacterized membrane protein YgdD (TMEM256/DUF423 family)|nr:DUF423 domain-containing protein [Parvularculaceae bacterium]